MGIKLTLGLPAINKTPKSVLWAMAKKTINEADLKAKAGQDREGITLKVVDSGMSVSVAIGSATLHTKRGRQRIMTPQTGLRFAQGLGLDSVVVELNKPGQKKK